MGRAGYMAILVGFGVVVMAVACVAAFAAAGAISADTPPRVAAKAGPAQVAAEPARPPSGAPASAPTEPRVEAGAGLPGKAPSTAKGEAAEAPRAEATRAGPTAVPAPVATRPSGLAGPEGSIAQRLDREATDGGMKVRALGAAKTTQGERAVIAIFVRVENVGQATVRVDPTFFKLTDRADTRYPISRVVENTCPAIELAPRSAAGDPGKWTECNVTFEVPRTAAGLALLYEATGGPVLRIPLPPEFSGTPAKP